MNEAIRSLLRKRKYLVTVEATDDGGVFVHYPRPILLFPTIPNIYESITPTAGGSDGVGVMLVASYLEQPKFLPVPEYAVRPFVAVEIASWCKRLAIDLRLAEYLNLDGEAVESLTDVISGPYIEENLQKEGFLNKLIVESCVDNFPVEYEKVAETHGVLAGYNLLKEFYL